MNIALIGYGKMGHTIEQVALQRGHNVVLRITSANKDLLNAPNLQQADVAIEFTNPEAACANVMACLVAGVPVISGSTGWNNGLPAVKQQAADSNTAFLHASNFSIGVNIFFAINKQLAALMNNYPDYSISLSETHHTAKKDAPSGTAITIAEQILANMQRKDKWALGNTNDDTTIAIEAHRVENVPGTHAVTYSSPIDDITITHTAHNRNGFALGAVLAAEFIAGRKGVFDMNDVLGIK